MKTDKVSVADLRRCRQSGVTISVARRWTLWHSVPAPGRRDSSTATARRRPAPSTAWGRRSRTWTSSFRTTATSRVGCSWRHTRRPTASRYRKWIRRRPPTSDDDGDVWWRLEQWRRRPALRREVRLRALRPRSETVNNIISIVVVLVRLVKTHL